METDKQTPTQRASNDKDDKKKGRHRKKHTFNAIRSQMEFYFSDANLSKDRYMSVLLREDPFIPLQEFLKFNKIKAIASSVEEIATALKNSELLTLSDDNQKVRRTKEFVERENSEDCTLYVESLPPKADLDWVRNVFSSYGKVAYVSLPRFKFSKKIKEFGFVEFEEEASVSKALKAFQTFGGVLSYEPSKAEKLASIKCYELDKMEMLQGAAGTSVGAETDTSEGQPDVKTEPEDTPIDPSVKEESTEQEDNSRPSAKRHQPESEECDPASGDDDIKETPAKRPKLDSESDGNEAQAPESGQEETTAVTTDVDETTDAEQTDDKQMDHETTDDKGKKKCRQRKGCSTIKKELQVDDKVYELKIMTKKEWRRLRNKYLDLQRKEASKLKRLFAQPEKHHQRGQAKSSSSGAASAGGKATVAGGLKSIKSSPRVNFYGAMPVEEEEQAGAEAGTDEPEIGEASVAIAKHPLFSFEPGLIVNVKFREPCVDVKDFRAELRQYPYVKYIDVKEGDFEAFVRVDKPASANTLVKEYSSAEHSAQILSGELEQQYWEKMMRDREDKLNKRVKTEKVRGRTKLIRKINTHIKFDDDDE
ncbi:la-related protein 7 [Anopheles aquasalis]|uniref:la-related protein 7 n=1 Tax=Anopheles aquasalis TaxID=42839 RepID=UPI00215B24C4|nr:la-related protein 7 [Anopheles aquasalis]